MDTTTDHSTVLVMDDDEDVRFIAGIMLKRLDLNAVFAESGTEAVACYQKALSEGKRFCAVILDLNIPGNMGGEEAVKLLRAIDPEVKAYVSCGNPYDPVMEDPTAYGFIGAISKPFHADQLQLLLGQQTSP